MWIIGFSLSFVINSFSTSNQKMDFSVPFNCNSVFKNIQNKPEIIPTYSAQFEEMLRKTSDAKIREVIEGSMSGKKIEVGADDDPLCLGCEHLNISPEGLGLTKKAIESKGIIFSGVTGNAFQLPYDSSTVSLIVIKNFPIFQPTESALTEFKKLLSEFKRVLRSDGEIIFMATVKDAATVYGVFGQTDVVWDIPRSQAANMILARHYSVAQEMGFKIVPFLSDSWGGLMIKP
jgi:SAM-dependent methyltransferase